MKGKLHLGNITRLVQDNLYTRTSSVPTVMATEKNGAENMNVDDKFCSTASLLQGRVQSLGVLHYKKAFFFFFFSSTI